MAEISQRTVAAMIALFDYLGCYDPVGYTDWNEGPRITASKLKNFLYSRNFDNKLLSNFEQLQWNFETILPALRDNSTWGKGETVLRALAAALIQLAEDLDITGESEFRIFVLSLRRDGLTENSGTVIDIDKEIVDIPAEVSAIEQLISDGCHDGTATLMHHLKTAERQFVSKEWGPSAGEWRKFYEEALRGVWRLTRQNDPQWAKRLEKPNFADVLNWLEEAKYFTSEEKNAYGAAWGFLSVGNHPGLPDPDVARLCKFLSLTFGHACLIKLEWWKKRKFRG